MKPKDRKKENEREAGKKPPRKPYRAPRLTVHGTLREITRKHLGPDDGGGLGAGSGL